MFDLRELVVPADPAFAAAGRRIYGERADLREAYADPEDWPFCKWLLTCGTLEYPEDLARYVPPLPPEHLRAVGCGGPVASDHLRTGIDDLELIADMVDVFAGVPLSAMRSVLDFACGSGRLLRWLQLALPDADLVGIDARRDVVEWCRANLRGDCRLGSFEPRIERSDGAFDLVVCLSLFTHLDRDSNRAWFAELARVCSPDGLIVLTAQGTFGLAVIADSAEHQDLYCMSREQARSWLRRLHDERFLFHRPPRPWAEAAQVGDDYGHTFLTEAFVEQEWSGQAELLGCVPALWCLLHDVYVLRPLRSDATVARS